MSARAADIEDIILRAKKARVGEDAVEDKCESAPKFEDALRALRAAKEALLADIRAARNAARKNFSDQQKRSSQQLQPQQHQQLALQPVLREPQLLGAVRNGFDTFCETLSEEVVKVW